MARSLDCGAAELAARAGKRNACAASCSCAFCSASARTSASFSRLTCCKCRNLRRSSSRRYAVGEGGTPSAAIEVRGPSVWGSCGAALRSARRWARSCNSAAFSCSACCSAVDASESSEVFCRRRRAFDAVLPCGFQVCQTDRREMRGRGDMHCTLQEFRTCSQRCARWSCWFSRRVSVCFSRSATSSRSCRLIRASPARVEHALPASQ